MELERANSYIKNQEVQKEKIYFLDLDDTLINTRSFFKELTRLAAEYDSNLAEEIAYQVARHRKEYGTSAAYNPCDTLKQNPDAWQAITEGIDVEKFIYEDAAEFVKKIMADTAIQAVILTHGHVDYQELKISGTFLEDLPMIVTSSAEKVKSIGEISSDGSGEYRLDLGEELLVSSGIALVDDKTVAFLGSADLVNFMGYLIQRGNQKNNTDDLPDNVQSIQDFSEIQI